MSKLEFSAEIERLAEEAERECKPYFEAIDKVAFHNSKKVLEAFLENGVAYQDFQEVNGYAFFDEARDKIEKVFAKTMQKSITAYAEADGN